MESRMLLIATPSVCLHAWPKNEKHNLLFILATVGRGLKRVFFIFVCFCSARFVDNMINRPNKNGCKKWSNEERGLVSCILVDFIPKFHHFECFSWCLIFDFELLQIFLLVIWSVCVMFSLLGSGVPGLWIFGTSYNSEINIPSGFRWQAVLLMNRPYRKKRTSGDFLCPGYLGLSRL